MEAPILPSQGADRGPRAPRPPTASEFRQALKTACILAATAISAYCLHHALASIDDEAARLEATEQRTMNNYWTATATKGSATSSTSTSGASSPWSGSFSAYFRSRRHHYGRSKVPVLSDPLQALAELHLGQVEASLAGRGARSQPTSPKALASADVTAGIEPSSSGSASKYKAFESDLKRPAHNHRKGAKKQQQQQQQQPPPPPPPEKPNFVVVLFDDSGYGDLGVHASERGDVSHTPFLDRFAKSSLRLLDFYVTASICTPSRASLLTGRYGPRSGVTGHVPPQSRGGLAPTERTLAAVLKPAGYRSLVVGKWHLGHVAPHDPLSHGFDEWLGLPFSSDMGCTDAPLGASNPELPETPVLKACPLRSNTYSSLQRKQSHRGESMRVDNAAVTSMKSGVSALRNSSADAIPATQQHTRTWPWQETSLEAELTPSQSFAANKWVAMGHGDPTVLPLYHACAPPGTHGRCGLCFKAIAETVNRTRPAANCANVNVKSRRSGSSRGKAHWNLKDTWKELKAAAIVEWPGLMSMTGDDLSGDGSGMRLSSTSNSISSRHRHCHHHQRSSGVGAHSIREQPASLWTLSDRLVSRAESFIMEHARPTAFPSSSSSGHSNSNTKIEDFETSFSDTSTEISSNGDSEKKKKKKRIPLAPPPFLLYFPLVHTHVPHTPHQRFVDQSRAALSNALGRTQQEAQGTYGSDDGSSHNHLGRSGSFDDGVSNRDADESSPTRSNRDNKEIIDLIEGSSEFPMASRVKGAPLVPGGAHHQGPSTATALLRGRKSGGRMGDGQHRHLSANSVYGYFDCNNGQHRRNVNGFHVDDDGGDDDGGIDTNEHDNYTHCMEGPRRGGGRGSSAHIWRAPVKTTHVGKTKTTKQKPPGINDSRSRQEVKVDRAMVAHELAVQYGASLREADDMVRRVVAALERAHVAHNTLTIVTSDNGPWLIQENAAGSPLPYRGGKFSTFDGGVRVFALMHWPRVLGSQDHAEHPSLRAAATSQGTQTPERGSDGVNSDSDSSTGSNSRHRRTTSSSTKKKRSQSRLGKHHRSLVWGDERGVVSNALCSAVDLLPTLAAAAGVNLPSEFGRSFDGEDLGPLLSLAGAYRRRHSVRLRLQGQEEEVSTTKAFGATNFNTDTAAAEFSSATTSAAGPSAVVTAKASVITATRKNALPANTNITAADAAHQEATAQAAWLRRRVVFIQEGGNFAAMRLGRYKIAGLPRLAIQPIAVSPQDAGTSTSATSGKGSNSGSSSDEAEFDVGAPKLTIYDLEAHPGEAVKLDTSANARFYLSRPAEQTTRRENDADDDDDGEEVVALTAREMVAVAVYIKEAHLADVRGTFQSSPHNTKGIDASVGLPCAHPYRKGSFCATSPCNSNRHPKPKG